MAMPGRASYEDCAVSVSNRHSEHDGVGWFLAVCLLQDGVTAIAADEALHDVVHIAKLVGFYVASLVAFWSAALTMHYPTLKPR
eukprot:1946320-Amphidinium_carterae.1